MSGSHGRSRIVSIPNDDDDGSGSFRSVPSSPEEIRQLAVSAMTNVESLANASDLVLYQVTDELNDAAILKLCKTSRALNLRLCGNDAFWVRRANLYNTLTNLTFNQLRSLLGLMGGTPRRIWTSMRRFFEIRTEANRLLALVTNDRGVPEYVAFVATALFKLINDHDDYGAVFLMFQQSLLPHDVGFFSLYDMHEYVLRCALRANLPYYLHLIEPYFNYTNQSGNWYPYLAAANAITIRWFVDFLATKPAWERVRRIIIEQHPDIFRRQSQTQTSRK